MGLIELPRRLVIFWSEYGSLLESMPDFGNVLKYYKKTL